MATKRDMTIVVTDSKLLGGNIKFIQTTGSKLDAVIHATAVGIMQRGHKHGDVSLLADLLKAMPKGGRPKALAAWFATFSPIRVNGDGKVGILKGDKANPWMVEEAFATPFWELNPEKDVVPFDLDKALASIFSRVEKQRKEGIIPATDTVLDSRLTALRKLVKAA